jgi:hypothetical protein
MKFSIRLLYLYLFSFIGLIIAVIGTVQLVDLGMKVYLFKGADFYESPINTKFDNNGKEVTLTEAEKMEQKQLQDKEATRQRQRQASNALAMLIVGIPLYKFHWRLIKKEDK